MSEEAKLFRNRKPRWRAARRREAKAKGQPIPNRQQVWHVKPGALQAIPAVILKHAVSGLTPETNSAWLKPGAARGLIALDRMKGGHPEVTKTEYKRCNLCNRPLLGSEAAKRRHLLETDPTTKTKPCGSNCTLDLQLKIWIKRSVS